MYKKEPRGAPENNQLQFSKYQYFHPEYAFSCRTSRLSPCLRHTIRPLLRV